MTSKVFLAGAVFVGLVWVGIIGRSSTVQSDPVRERDLKMWQECLKLHSKPGRFDEIISRRAAIDKYVLYLTSWRVIGSDPKEHSNEWFDAREWESFTLGRKRARIVALSAEYLALSDELWEEFNPPACRSLPGNPTDAEDEVLLDRGKPLNLHHDEFLESLRKES